MKNLGSSASSLEMVEIIENLKKEDEGFDLLASEVDALNLEKKEDEDDFEVIPIPSCFDLDVPFELIDGLKTGELEKEEATSKKQQAPLILQSTLNQNPMEELVKMGFGNRVQNKRLLDLHNNDIEKVLQVVFEENQVDWAGMRH